MDKSAAFPARKLVVTDLEIQRGGEPLVSNLSFSVSSGSTLLLRGPNGAKDEFLLAAIAQNLRKLAKLRPQIANPEATA